MRRALLLLCIAAVPLYLARAQVLSAMARFLDVSEPAETVDRVMVLGGGSETRPFVAAALVKAGLARQVLVPTVKLAPHAEDGIIPPEHEVMKQTLVARGVPAQSIVLLPGECSSTFDEARALADFLQTHPTSSVAVVTTNYHTRRARWIFRRVLGQRAAGVRFVAAPPDGFGEANWWQFEEGCAAYLAEYVKLGFYFLRR